jgi:hypothetical protein
MYLFVCSTNNAFRFIENPTTSLWLTLSSVFVGGTFSAVFFASWYNIASVTDEHDIISLTALHWQVVSLQSTHKL